MAPARRRAHGRAELEILPVVGGLQLWTTVYAGAADTERKALTHERRRLRNGADLVTAPTSEGRERRRLPSGAPASRSDAVWKPAPFASVGRSRPSEVRALWQFALFGSCDSRSSLRTEIQHVHVRPRSGVVCQVIARVIRIVVQHDVVGVPEPVADVRVVSRRDAEEEAVEAESLWSAAGEAIDAGRADRAREVTVLPRTIEVIAGVVLGRSRARPSDLLRPRRAARWDALAVAR